MMNTFQIVSCFLLLGVQYPSNIGIYIEAITDVPLFNLLDLSPYLKSFFGFQMFLDHQKMKGIQE